MTNEELNKWLADEIWVYPGCCSSIECVKYDIAKETAIKMAAWKQEQMIEYLYKNIQSLLKDYGVSEASADIATQLFLANFKQAMEADQ